MVAPHMSAFGGKADMAFCAAYVCFWPKRTCPSQLRMATLGSKAGAWHSRRRTLGGEYVEDSYGNRLVLSLRLIVGSRIRSDFE